MMRYFRKSVSVLCIMALLLAMIPTPAYAGTSGTEAACGSSTARPTAKNEPCDHPAALVGGSYSPKTFGDAPDTAWSRLQSRINNAADRDVITLDEDIIAGSEDTRSLVFGDNKTEKSLTLDLNGHKIDRNLGQASSSGQVIVVRAKFNLTIRDSSEEKNGSITGGKGTDLGGGIYVIYGGSLTLEGGSIEYNSATKGGGIFSEGSLTLAGGSVEHNTAYYGGGVCLDRYGQFTLSGGSVTGNEAVYYGGGVYTSSNNGPALMGGSITGNSAAEGGGGLYSTQHVSLNSGSAITLCNNYGSSEDIPSNALLVSGKSFNVSGAPAEGSSIHVSVQQTPTRENPVTIAFSNVNCASAFTVDNQPELTEIAWRNKKVVLKLVDDVMTWSELQQALNDGGTWDPEKQEYIIRLGADVTAGSDDNALRFCFAGGHSVIVDLCGHSINRGLGAAVENGNVLTVEKGTLILRDSVGGGTITGGNNTGSGGGVIILSDGALTMEGGSVTGNMTRDGAGGGIYVSGGKFTVSGNPAVVGNIKSSTDGLNMSSNVYLESGSVIALGGALTDGASIGVGAAYEGRFTEGNPAHLGQLGYFTADDLYRIYPDAENYPCIESGTHHHYTASAVWADDYSSAQLTLACPCGQTEHIGIDQVAITKTENADHSFNISLTRTYEGQSYTVALENVPSFHVTVDANGGQGAADFYLPVAQGKNYAALPLTKDGIAGITPPSGAMFDALKKGGDAWHVGETVQVTEDSEFDAQWRSTWALVNEALGAGGAITLYNDITPAAGDSYLYVPQRITATLDLNGHTIDRALKEAVARGYVLRVDGTLNLNGGTITGGNNTGNGGGLYVGSGAALTTDDVNITQNQTQQDGGGIYIADGDAADVTLNNTQITNCTAMEKGGGLCLGDGGDQSSNVVGLVLLVGGIVTFCAGGTGGGIYLYKGKLKLDSGTQVLNNTDINGKNFNNIDLNEGGSASIVLPEAVSAPIAIGLPTAAAAAALPLWVKGIMVAGAVLIAGGLLTIYCDWATSKGEQGGETCKHPSWNTEAADWDEEYYSKVDEYKSCTVCGFSKMETHTPAVTVQSETQQTEYTAVLAEGEVTRVVKPYIVLATTGISELSGITEMFPVAHGRGLGATYVLPPVPWTIEGYEFEAWAMGDETITQVAFTPIPYEDEQIATVLATWKVSVTYDPNVLLPESFVVVGTPPQNPNPSMVSPGPPHELLPNSWEQYFVGIDGEGKEVKSLYVFDGWDVSIGVKFTDTFTIDYIWESATDMPGKMPGEMTNPVTFPIKIKARWRSPWKIMGETLNQLGAYKLPMDTYATQLDSTMSIKTLPLGAEPTLDLGGYKAHAYFLSTTLNPISVSTKLHVKDSSEKKTGCISGGKSVKSGGGVTVSEKALFTLESGSIRDNITLITRLYEMAYPDGGGVMTSGGFVMEGGSITDNSAPGNGGGVCIDSKGEFRMMGGEISGNKARYDALRHETAEGSTGQGGGVYVGGSFRVSGKVVIKNNTVDGKANNVYLPNGKTIAVIEKLDEQAEIHVSMETPGVFTSGLKANAGDEAWGSAANFVSDDTNYEVVINADGEAELKTKAPKFDKTELELGGMLKLRFYMEYYEGWDPTGDRMAFTVNGGETRTEDYNPDTGYFVCPVNAYQMADKIEAVYYHNNEEIVRKEYTVKENLDYLKDHTGGDTLALVKATMNYGHYIQPYLAAANNWTTGRDHAIMPADGPITPDGNPAQDYGFAFTTTEEYNQYVDHTEFYLTLDAGTELNVRVYLKNGGTVTGTANGAPVNPVSRSGNSWVLSLSGIPSNALDIQYPFSCWVDNQKVFDLRISALTYANILLGRSNSSDVIEKTALTALYEYAMAAKKYRPE